MQRDKSTPLLYDSLDSLHKEMELVGYGKKNGQNRRKLSRKQATVRTKKRKLLEKEDAEQLAILADEKLNCWFKARKKASGTELILW